MSAAYPTSADNPYDLRMDLATFDQLLSPPGAVALAAAADLSPTGPTFLGCFEKLRKRFPADLAKAALEAAILRVKARDKFTRADAMFFTREALEQASAEVVSRHRASRFRRFATVADLCCGIGGDAIGLAATGVRVVAIDRGPLRVRMAEANLAAYGFSADVRCADALTDPFPACDALFCDPARRTGERRFVSVADYQPPPRAVLARVRPETPAAFKLAPAVPWADLEAFDGEAEFVALGGELKECVLWLGLLRAARRRATVLPAGDTIAADAPAEPPPAGPPLRYVYDPDPAVTRSGLVTNLAGQLSARLLDPGIAFLSADEGRPTPFAVCYEVEETLPFHARRLAEVLRGRGVGRVTVVKRGSAVDADEMTKKLKLSGNEHRFVLLTQVVGKPVAIIARRR